MYLERYIFGAALSSVFIWAEAQDLVHLLEGPSLITGRIAGFINLYVSILIGTRSRCDKVDCLQKHFAYKGAFTLVTHWHCPQFSCLLHTATVCALNTTEYVAWWSSETEFVSYYLELYRLKTTFQHNYTLWGLVPVFPNWFTCYKEFAFIDSADTSDLICKSRAASGCRKHRTYLPRGLQV